MSYTQLLKKWERESNKKYKQEREEYKKQKAIQEKLQYQIYLAKGNQEKQEIINYQEKQKRMSIARQEITENLQKNNPFTYFQYLIIYDIFCHNYSQIISDLKNDKITISDIKLVINFLEGYSKELICSYWKEELLKL